jgi:hypothetical protein
VLAGYAANGSIVHYLDGTVLAQQVAANPGAYGFTNGLVCPIFPNTTCVVSSNGYLFYGDALHLTSQGFALVAQYVARQLAAPLTLQAPSDLGFDTARQWGRTLSSRTDLYGRSNGPDGLRIYAVGDAFTHDIGNSEATSQFEVRGAGVTVGAEYGLPGGLIGIAGNYSRPKARFNNNASDVRAHSWQIGGYGSLAMGGLFGQAYLGYGKDHDDVTRTGVLDDMAASPHGNHTIAGAKGGYLMDFVGLKAGPIVALDYARAKVDGYTESGDAALTLNVGDQSLKALTGQAGVEVRGDLTGLHAFADLTAEHDFTGNDRTISFSQTNAPGDRRERERHRRIQRRCVRLDHVRPGRRPGDGRPGRSEGPLLAGYQAGPRRPPKRVRCCFPKRPLRVPGLPSVECPRGRGATLWSWGIPKSSSSRRRISSRSRAASSNSRSAAALRIRSSRSER